MWSSLKKLLHKQIKLFYSLCPLDFYHEQFSEKKPEKSPHEEIATGLTIHDILPEDPSKYDKMRPQNEMEIRLLSTFMLLSWD
ncbi:hypothetical protein NQ317_015558 [Molorchus minor]|uniref:Uncharacterized protein n=1 Tax=Molorchus minor TaxID=1323400 RepID=A0ABQ9IU14_9CUCU|nr:hypothetical protein NQ317_015558 [Molorchus minor]